MISLSCPYPPKTISIAKVLLKLQTQRLAILVSNNNYQLIKVSKANLSLIRATKWRIVLKWSNNGRTMSKLLQYMQSPKTHWWRHPANYFRCKEPFTSHPITTFTLMCPLQVIAEVTSSCPQKSIHHKIIRSAPQAIKISEDFNKSSSMSHKPFSVNQSPVNQTFWDPVNS